MLSIQPSLVQELKFVWTPDQRTVAGVVYACRILQEVVSLCKPGLYTANFVTSVTC